MYKYRKPVEKRKHFDPDFESGGGLGCVVPVLIGIFMMIWLLA
jgi:hypothetical protein